MENGSNRITIVLDGNSYEVEPGTTVLEVARQNGIHIPTLCHHPDLSSWGGCRMCVVQIDGAPKLAASCVTPVRAGMTIVTDNERIRAFRKTILEFLFSERNHNCMICPQSGDCELQSLAYALQMDHLTVSTSFKHFSIDVSHPYLTLDHNRCILCGRCVRACSEIAGNYVLGYQHRGSKSVIALDLDEKRELSSCTGCGVCVQVCPTGALNNRYATHYAVSGHSKNWQTIDTICPECGFLCPIVAWVRDNRLIKINGRLASSVDRPDKGQLCAKGRFESMQQPGKRLDAPLLKTPNGDWQKTSWEQAAAIVQERLSTIMNTYGDQSLCGLASSRCSNEELMLFGHLMSHWGIRNVDTLDGDILRKIDGVLGNSGDPIKENPFIHIPDAEMIVVLGGQRIHQQPLLVSLARRSLLEKKIPVAIADSSDFLAPYTTYFFNIDGHKMESFIRALTDELEDLPNRRHLLQALTNTTRNIVDDAAAVKPYDILSQIGFDADDRNRFFQFVADLAGCAKVIIIVGNEALGFGPPPVSTVLKKQVPIKRLLSCQGMQFILLKPFGNSAGSMKLGLHPCFDHDTFPPKGGLVLISGNEAISEKVLKRLNLLEFLAVLTPYASDEIMSRANLLIPRPILFEEDGTFTSLDGSQTAFKPKILNPPDGIRNTWKTLVALSQDIEFQNEYPNWDILRKRAAQQLGNRCQG